MLISEENILELMPQRYPMVMIDSLVSCDEKQAVSQLTIRQDNLFLNRHGFTAAGMMEAMAQTVAARTGYLMKSKPEGANKKIPIVVIGSIKNFRMNFQPSIGSVIVTTVSIEHEVLLATVVKVKVEMDGKLAAECDMQIFLTEDQPEKP
jgi:3-hydroxymyristoyl/3-hydroxydecanoyl-(acyl carrier protein) dehydratase